MTTDAPIPGAPTLSPDYVNDMEGTAAKLEGQAAILNAEGKPRDAAKLLCHANMIRWQTEQAKATANYQPPRSAEPRTMQDRAFGVGPEQAVPPPAMPMPTENASADDLQ